MTEDCKTLVQVVMYMWPPVFAGFAINAIFKPEQISFFFSFGVALTALMLFMLLFLIPAMRFFLTRQAKKRNIFPVSKMGC
jgi:hypothetical protein